MDHSVSKKSCLAGLLGSTETNISESGLASAGSAYPCDTSAALDRLIESFNRSGRTQNVSFRKLVPWLKVGERATHYIHSYPAKLLPHIAHFFLASDLIAGDGATVLDPFGGTGTVALETILSGRKAIYSDANPLARLIAEVKTSRVSMASVRSALERVDGRFLKSRSATPPQVVNINHWYEPSVIRQLCRLRAAIEAERPSSTKKFLLIAFSSVARRVSRADPRLSVPVLLRTDPESKNNNSERRKIADVRKAFSDQVEANLRRQAELARLCAGGGDARCVGDDARDLRDPGSWERPLESDSVDLVITSPPYAGAQKYIRSSSLSLGWLGFTESTTLKELENQSIGREHLPKAICNEVIETGISAADRVIKKIFSANPVRAAIASTYLVEMKSAIKEMARVVRPGGYVVLVIGNNEVCGYDFMSSKYLESMFVEAGFGVRLRMIDEIKSRGLMTKRNKTAGLIAREWVLLLQKSG